METSLRAAYVGRLVSLKTPCNTEKLHYAHDGQPVGACEPVPWTTYGTFRVQDVKLDRDNVRLQGKLAVLALRRLDSRLDVFTINTKESVSVTLELRSPYSADDLKDDLSRILQAGTVEERLISHWKPGSNPASSESGDEGVVGYIDGTIPVYDGKSKGGLKVGKPLNTPEPHITSDVKGTGGTVIFKVVVNQRGYPDVLEITHSVNDGLDGAAVVSVSRWRFEPATRDNRPQAVRMTIQVGMRLYH